MYRLSGMMEYWNTGLKYTISKFMDQDFFSQFFISFKKPLFQLSGIPLFPRVLGVSGANYVLMGPEPGLI